MDKIEREILLLYKRDGLQEEEMLLIQSIINGVIKQVTFSAFKALES